MSRLSARLLELKASQLRQISFLLGLPSTGTKTELSRTIQAQLIPPATPSPLPEQPNRILSIDMGIKNLGLCVLEPTDLHQQPSAPSPNNLNIKVLDWRRINLLTSHPKVETPDQDMAKLDFSPSILSQLAVQTTQKFLTTYNPTTILIERQRFRSGGASAVQEWTLRVNMLESMLWATLECLRAQHSAPNRQSEARQPFPATYSVLPARVAQFWCNAPPGIGTIAPRSLYGADTTGITAKTSSICEGESEEGEGAPSTPDHGEKLNDKRRGNKPSDIKKAKIAIVRSWLASSNIAVAGSSQKPTTTPASNPDEISLHISPQIYSTAEAFLLGPEGVRKRDRESRKQLSSSAKSNGIDSVAPDPGDDANASTGRQSSKLDDLADSLLQGVAWLRWRNNERIMRQQFQK